MQEEEKADSVDQECQDQATGIVANVILKAILHKKVSATGAKHRNLRELDLASSSNNKDVAIRRRQCQVAAVAQVDTIAEEVEEIKVAHNRQLEVDILAIVEDSKVDVAVAADITDLQELS